MQLKTWMTYEMHLKGIFKKLNILFFAISEENDNFMPVICVERVEKNKTKNIYFTVFP